MNSLPDQSLKSKEQTDQKDQQRKQININEFELKSLHKGNMLSDAVINSCLQHFQNEFSRSNVIFVNTFFYCKLERDGPVAASQWISCSSIDTYSHFLIPIDLHAHWFLIDLDFNYHYINVYDSLKNAPRRNKVVQNIKSFITYHGIKDKMTVRHPNVPKQFNDVDCGAFLLRYAYCIFRFKRVDKTFFNSMSILTFRKNLYQILKDYCKDLTEDDDNDDVEEVDGFDVVEIVKDKPST